MNAAEPARRMQDDEAGALDEVFGALQNRAQRVAYGITRDWQLAEDVVAEAFLALYQRRQQLDPDRGAEGWLMRVVANGAISAVRKRSALRRTMARLRGALIRPLDPADVAIDELDRAGVRQVLKRSSVEDRTVLVLRYYLDLSPSQMAEMLGWPEGTVNTRLHRARMRFRAAIGKYGESNDGD